MTNIREIEPKPVKKKKKDILEVEGKILNDILTVKHLYGLRKSISKKLQIKKGKVRIRSRK